LIFILCISTSPGLFGQFDIEWSKSIDEFNDCEGFSVEQTTDGGYIAVGSIYLLNGHNIWLLKFDADGNIVWFNTFGRGGYDGGRAVHQTSDGGYLISGGDDDLWLIKTDANGDSLWTRTYGNPNWHSALKQTIDGGYIILNGNKLLRTDTNGDSLWTRTYEGQGTALERTTDGGFIITGSIWTDTVSWNEDVMLIKTDNKGDTLWTRIYGESGFDGGNFVQQTLDGGYIVAAGRAWNHWDFSEGFLIKLDSIGNTQWISTDSLYSSEIVNQMEDGSYLVLGDSYESNYYNICLTKIDEYGRKIWTEVLEQEGEGWCRGGQPTKDGGFIIIGGIDDHTGRDAKLWIAKVGDNLTSFDEETSAFCVRIFPNPTNGLLNIESIQSGRQLIKITSLNGQLVFSEVMEGTSHQIDHFSLRKGVYLITIRSKDTVITEKIVKL